MDIEHLIGTMITGTLRGGSKRSHGAGRFLTSGRGSFLNASTLLALGGLVWGVAETLQQQQSAPAPTAAPPLPPALPSSAAASAGVSSPQVPPGGLQVPPPLPGTAPAVPAADLPVGAERMVRLMISAARADGDLTGVERQTILDHARTAGVEPLVAAEIDRATPLETIVEGITDRGQREDLYVLAYAIVRADEAVTGSERIFLAQLAARLGLDDPAVGRLEQQAAARIDASLPDGRN